MGTSQAKQQGIPVAICPCLCWAHIQNALGCQKIDRPFCYWLRKENLQHQSMAKVPGVTRLGLKWTPVPIDSAVPAAKPQRVSDLLASLWFP